LEYSVGFANPLALALLALVPAVIWISRRGSTTVSRVRGRLALVTRVLVVVLVVLALAEIQLVRENDDLCVMFALDASDSIPRESVRQAVDFVNDQVRRAGAGDVAGVVVFGADSEIEASPVHGLKLGEALQSIVDGQTTNIAKAVRLATASFPAGYNRRLVLVTDGNENQGAALEDVAYARANNVQVDVMPVHFVYENEFLVDKVVVPEEVAENEPFQVKIAVNSERAGQARLLLYQSDRLMATSTVELEAGVNVFTHDVVLAKSGLYTFEARVEKIAAGDDKIAANNTATAYTAVKGPPAVLCVSRIHEEIDHLCAALDEENITVHRCPPGELPDTLFGLRGYDALVLANLPAEALTDEQLALLEKYVDVLGGGLVAIGGTEAFSAGAYWATPLEEILPVRSDLKQRVTMPSGALVLIMHTCEMPDANYWAEQIAISAIKALSRRDRVGLVYYDGLSAGGTTWLFPIQPAGNKGHLIRLVRTMAPGDMPGFAPPMEMALAGLEKTRASLKHMVIISDGDPAAPSQGLVDRIVNAGITISTVGIAPHSPRDVDILRTVADEGNGRFYNVKDPQELPAIFIREARRVSRPPVRLEEFKPELVYSSEPLVGIRREDLPILAGYVVTEAKALAATPIVSHRKEPILAHWHYGLGKTVAFTSDATNRWAAQWVEWDKFAKFWCQTVRWAMRSVQKGRFHVATAATADGIVITVDAFNKDIDYLSTLGVGATVVTPDMEAKSLPLEPVAPGRFEARLPIAGAGTYFASINYREGSGSSGLLYTGLTVPYSREYRYLETNLALVEQIASAAGGKIISRDGYNAFSHDLPPTRSAKPIWPIILTVAACLFLVDVGIRKIAIDLQKVFQGAWAFVRNVLWPTGAAGKPAPAMETHISRLKRTRREVTSRFGEPTPPAEVGEVLRQEDVPEQGRAPEKAREAPSAPDVQPAGAAEGESSHIKKLLAAKRAAREKLESQENEENPDTD